MLERQPAIDLTWPRSNMDVPAHAATPVARTLYIESYVGILILRKDGSPFGTMCAIDALPATGVEQHQPLVEFVARMLGFAVDRQRSSTARRASSTAKAGTN